MRKLKKEGKQYKLKGLLFMLPSLTGVTVFYAGPYIDVICRSFQNNLKKEFCGSDNYLSVFSNAAFRLAAVNTLRFELCCIPVLLLLSFGLACLIRNLSWKQQAKTLLLLPLAIPAASIAFSWKLLLEPHGLVNRFLHQTGLPGIDFLGSDDAFWVLVGTYVWKNLGFTVILWIAAMDSIPSQLYEAASLDGAGFWNKLWYITLPNLKGMAFTILLLSVLNSFKVYREAYLVAGSYPHESMYLLQHMFGNWYLGMKLDEMAAGSVLFGSVILLLVMIRMSVSEKEACLHASGERRMVPMNEVHGMKKNRDAAGNGAELYEKRKWRMAKKEQPEKKTGKGKFAGM